MSDQTETAKDAKISEPLKKVWPTLFIGVGGTGMEIALRVRRRILNHVWGERDNPIRIANLTEFSLAQFINFDLDAGSKTESGKATATDPLADLVKFKDEEKFIFSLDMDKYLRTDGELDTYPHIASWFPLSRKKALELNITRPEGAGQIRAISRLYFFDKYLALKSMIESKINTLMDNVTSSDKTKRLGLTLERDSLRVVVIASSAGGTGSGSFLDMGYLARTLAKKRIKGAKVDLCFMLPSGFSGTAGSRTEANTYGALMELETCFSQEFQFVKGWSRDGEDIDFISPKPFDDVFLFDTINLAMRKTAKKEDVFDMVADILFEDFTSEKFADRKRSIAPNQYAVHKTDNFFPPVNEKKYGSMKLRYSKAYSAFGQSIIDTQLDQRRDEIACGQVNDMLKVFFGIASDTGAGREVPPPTPEDGRGLLRVHVYCSKENFKLAYLFVSDGSPYHEGLEFSMHKLVDQLLYDGDKPMLGRLHDRINRGIDEILASTEKDQRLPRVDKLLGEIDRDLGIEGGVTDKGAGGLEKSIQARRDYLFKKLVDENSGLVKDLWVAVDNKEKGGIDYTILFIEQIKDCIENDATGLLRDMEDAQKWFSGLWEKLRGAELQKLKDRIGDTKGGGVWGRSGTKESHAEAILQQMGETIRWYGEARLREVACREATVLLKDLTCWLGQHQGLDEKAKKRWSPDSFAGKLAGYKKLVIDLMSNMNDEVIRTREATKQGHAAYQIVKASTADLDAARNLDPKKAMDWAKIVFDNMGGSRVIFQDLSNDLRRAELLGKLRNFALDKLPAMGTDEENPLYKVLLSMQEDRPAELQQLFQHCLEMAMPWVEADLEGTWVVTSNQYSCIIGVDAPALFNKQFGDEIRSVIPARTHMNADKIQFESGVPGKLTCYVELSGLPLPALSLLSNWKTNYNIEGKKIPIHTHKDKTLFVHPMAPSVGTLDRLAEHFKLYIQGVVLGVLKLRVDDPAERVYCHKVSGEELSIGNERAIRLEGVGSEHLVFLQKKVAEAVDRIKSPAQVAGLVLLYDFYTERVYPPKMIKKENLAQDFEKGFCHVMCVYLGEEARNALGKKCLGSGLDPNDLIDRLKGTDATDTESDFDTLNIWTDQIEGSETDVYKNEVGNSHMPKRILKREFFQVGWLEEQLKLIDPKIPPPPPPPPILQVYVAANGQQNGPFDINTLRQMAKSGQLTRDSLVWMDGMGSWASASTVATIAGVFGATPPPLPPPLPPA